MNRYYIILIIIITISVLISQYNFSYNNIKYMNIYEILEFSIKLFLINNAGITDYSKNGLKILDLLTNDQLLIKMHRKLHKKYGKIILTNIITIGKHYYILDPELSKNILEDSPFKFNAGNMKKGYFNNFVPNNLGISECNLKEGELKCPWMKRRDFNEKVLGTKHINNFYNNISSIINKNIDKQLFNINDFKELSYKIVSDTIYGDQNNINILKGFTEKHRNENFMNSDFYNDYLKSLINYKKNSLLHYSKLYKNDNQKIINDQIPHWFGPFDFIISYLIPNLLCIIINFKDIHEKILNEINNNNFDILSTNTYFHNCIIEHIRLFNTININIQRSVKEDMLYNNIEFKKNDQIFILFSSILRDEDKFHEPDNFIPERWDNKSNEEKSIVFGIGPQQCPSKRITPLYYKYIIYYLLKKYKYKTTSPILKSKQLYFINPYNISFE